MSDDSEAQAAPDMNETAAAQGAPDDVHNDGVNTEALERDLEKKIDKFRKLWLLMDSPNENERAVAAGRLLIMMKNINSITEQMTGEPGTLSFAELLDKIESGGSDADPQEVQELRLMVEQYDQANTALKAAEGLLSREVKRLRFLLKTRQYEEETIKDPEKIVNGLIENRDALQQLCADLKSFIDVPKEQWESSYTRMYDEVQRQRYDLADAQYRGFRRNFLSWLIKKQGLPGNFEDLLEIQCMTRAQQEAVKRERALVERIEELEETIGSFDKAINYVLHQNYADDKTREALSNLEQLEVELSERDHIARELEEAQKGLKDTQKTCDELRRIADEKDAAIHILEQLVNKLRKVEQIEDPLHERELQAYTASAAPEQEAPLSQQSLEDLRKACAVYASAAFDRAGGGISHEDALREIKVLREQVSVLQGDKKNDRFELVSRDHWKLILKKNKELEDALEAFRLKYDETMGGAKDWEDRMRIMRENQHKIHHQAMDELKASHEAIIAALKEDHEKNNTKVMADYAVKSSELLTQLRAIQGDQATFRRNVHKSARSGIGKTIIGTAIAGAIAGGGLTTIYLDSVAPEQPEAAVTQDAQQQTNTATGGTQLGNDNTPRTAPLLVTRPQ